MLGVAAGQLLLLELRARNYDDGVVAAISSPVNCIPSDFTVIAE